MPLAVWLAPAPAPYELSWTAPATFPAAVDVAAQLARALDGAPPSPRARVRADAEVELKYCKGCGICDEVCPTDAIVMAPEHEHGETGESDT